MADSSKLTTALSDHGEAMVSGDRILGNNASAAAGSKTGLWTPDELTTYVESSTNVKKRTLWVPANSMTPATTSGPAAGQIETTTNKINVEVLDFDTTADEYAHFNLAFPKEWNEGAVTFQVFWTAATGGTTGIAVALQGVCIGDNLTNDTAYGTAVVVTDDAQTGANEIYVSAESAAVTIGNTPAVDEVCFFRLFRDVSDVNDDLAEDMRLVGIKLFYSTNALSSD